MRSFFGDIYCFENLCQINFRVLQILMLVFVINKVLLFERSRVTLNFLFGNFVCVSFWKEEKIHDLSSPES